jgi:hypothetical protein
VTYRCYLGWEYYNVIWTQFLEVAGTSCTFTRNPTWVAEIVIHQGDITPGAHLIDYNTGWLYYAVAARMPEA